MAQAMRAAESEAVVRARSYIDRAWIEGSGEEIEVKRPSDGRLVSTTSYVDFDELQAAVGAAKRAQRDWARTHIAERVALLAKAAAAFDSRLEEAIQLCATEMGKTLEEAREDASATGEYLRILGQDALRQQGKVAHNMWDPTQNKRVITTYAPHGVVAILTPWNFPLAIPVENITPALATGNTVVWKPSEVTPACSQLLMEALVEADFPAGVMNMLQGAGDIGGALVEHPEVAMVSFTGSTRTGERIAAAAGVKKLLLELGGNGPIIVMKDADVDAAVDASVHACFYLAGQCCTAGERLLVHSDVHDEFVEKLVAKTQALKVGDPLLEETQMGPLSIPSSLEKTVRHVSDAKERGAQVVYGGSSDGMYHDPTVLIDVTPEMEIAQEETFGPVAPIIRFDSDDEALEVANGTRYGLNVSVWTRSLKTAWEMAEAIDAGTVHINETTNHWELFAPFGGVKQSGLGRIDGEDAMREFTTPKQITFDLDRA